MPSTKIPDDLIKFLNSGRTLEYDAAKCTVGTVSLYAPDQIQLKEFRVNSQHGARWGKEDPNADEPGDYIVSAYDLVAKCQHHRAEGALIYIPKLNAYGNYDDDHQSITYYPRITWWNIVGDPIRYLTGCFRYPLDTNPTLNPVGQFQFRAN